MCGRYVSNRDPAFLSDEFRVTQAPATVLLPDYNVAPTKEVYAVLERDIDGSTARTLSVVRWGLVPSWAKDPSIGNRMINARVETAAEKPSFRRAWAHRRAILPAAGYYEWHTPAAGPTTGSGRPRKQPYFIQRADEGTLALAGLYEIWRDRSIPDDRPDAWLWTVAILTTAATGPVAFIHDRMPVMLAAEEWDAWLDPHFSGDPHTLLDPATEATGLVAYPVATTVNSVRNNGPELIAPLPAD